MKTVDIRFVISRDETPRGCIEFFCLLHLFAHGAQNSQLDHNYSRRALHWGL